MSREEMYHKPKYGQNDTVWVERAADQPLEGQVYKPFQNYLHLLR
jgi:hypothetical protein